jgi:hypothetical protein
LVSVLVDGRLEGGLDLAQAVLQQVAEADQHGQVDALGLEPVDQQLEVDCPVRVLGGMDTEVSLVADGEVAFAPVGHFIQVGGLQDRPAAVLLFHLEHVGIRFECRASMLSRREA